MDDKSEPPNFIHPQKVEKALLWAGTLHEDQLLARAKTKGFPPEAVLRLIRRYRVEGNQKLSDALAKLLYDRAIKFLEVQYVSVPHSYREQIISDAVAAFIRAAVHNDAVDYWEIEFFKCLKNKASDSYQKIKDQYQNEDFSEDLSDHLNSEELLSQSEICSQLHENINIENVSLLKAISESKLNDDELKFLFALLEHRGVPFCSNKAETDLVRITGFSRTKIFELRGSVVSKLIPIKEKVANHD
jgi:hypothetical protein